MIEIGIDTDALYPYFNFWLIEKDQWNPEIRFNISEQELEELRILEQQANLYQTKLKQLFELHGGVI